MVLAAINLAVTAFPWDHNLRRLPARLAVETPERLTAQDLLSEIQQARLTDPFVEDLHVQEAIVLEYMKANKQ